VVEQDLRSAELINVGVGLALGAQLGFVGQLPLTLTVLRAGFVDP
jgi:hypothetical protein